MSLENAFKLESGAPTWERDRGRVDSSLREGADVEVDSCPPLLSACQPAGRSTLTFTGSPSLKLEA